MKSVSSRGFHSAFVRMSDMRRHHDSLKPETFTFLFSVVSHGQEDRAPAQIKMIMQDILPYEVGRYGGYTWPKKKV